MKHGHKTLAYSLGPGLGPRKGWAWYGKHLWTQAGALQPCLGAAPHPLSSPRAQLCNLAPHALWLRWHKCCSLRHSTVVGQGRKSHHRGTPICGAFSRRRKACWAEPALQSGCWTLLWGRNPAGGSAGAPQPRPHPHALVAPTVARPSLGAGT